MDVTARHMLQVDVTSGSDGQKTIATVSAQLRAAIAASSISRLPMASVEQRMCSLELSDDRLCVTCTDGTRGAHVSIVVAWNRCFQRLTVAVAKDVDHKRSPTNAGNQRRSVSDFSRHRLTRSTSPHRRCENCSQRCADEQPRPERAQAVMADDGGAWVVEKRRHSDASAVDGSDARVVRAAISRG